MNRTLRSASLAALCAVSLGAGSLFADAVVTFGSIPAGADEAGRVQLYAPDPSTGGSSISHWDLATSPLLMWPAISSLLSFHQTDLTMPLFRDLGYPDGTSNFTVEYLDPAGFGFNETDAAPAAPGNPGTTFGEQRRFALEAALAKWGGLVGKNTPTKVLAVHIDNFCDASSAVLASAGPTCVYTFTDESDNPLFAAGTMLAEHLADFDQTDCTFDFDDDGDDENGDIIVYVNENIDYDGSCLGGAGYYYGQDANEGTQINFNNVILHELGHGIGFSSFTDRNPSSSTFGEFYFDVPGVYDFFILDNSTGKHFDQMSNAEREDSIVNGPNVVWDGENVIAESAGWAKLPSVEVLFPSGGGEFEAQAAAFGAPVFGEDAVTPTGQVVIANPERACTPIANVAGKIVLIERNDCTFITKFENAVAAGATAVIVYNSSNPSSGGPEDLVAMAGVSDNTTVPAVFLRRSDGLELRSLVTGGPDLSCTPTSQNACLLGNRFQVNVGYTTVSSSGVGQVMTFNGARAESNQSAFFYFFDNANFEMGVKMVDACSFNDSFWVFVSGLTNQGYAVNILDTFTGQTRNYTNPLGNYPQTIGATDGVTGFDCTPGDGARVEKPTPAQIKQVLAQSQPDPLGDSIVFAGTEVSPFSLVGVIDKRGPGTRLAQEHDNAFILVRVRKDSDGQLLPFGSHRLFQRWYRVPVQPGEGLEGALARLASYDYVEVVEPNGLIKRHIPQGVRSPKPSLSDLSAPNDPWYPILQWNMGRIGVEQAWLSTLGSGVRVAVVDSGVTHAGVDLDCQTFVDEYNSFTEVSGPGAAETTLNGHGTHVAGTIAQCTGNGIGVVGVAPEATLMPIKAFPEGSDTVAFEDAAQGIVWATDHGASVINLSLGADCDGQSWPSCSVAILNDSIAYALSLDVVVVAASGNSLQGSVGHPGNVPGVIAVGATDIQNFLANYSNYGPGLSVMAPGGETSTDIDANGFLDGIWQETWQSECGGAIGVMDICALQGTSMAAPHVSGIAALLRAAHPEADRLQVRQAIEQSATDLGNPGYDIYFGNGLVNAPGALQKLSQILAGGGVECVEDSDTACQLVGRFQVEVSWTTASGTGSAQVMSFGSQRAASEQSSFWWFFDPANFEMGVKMVDGCSLSNTFWVFVSGLTNQAYTVTITDTFTGRIRTYSNPLGSYPQTIGATGAVDGFPCS